MNYRLTEPQKRIWLVEKIADENLSHILSGQLIIETLLDYDKLQRALNVMIKNNDVLRLRIEEKNGEPFQYVDEKATYSIVYKDFRQTHLDEIEKWIEERIRLPLVLTNSLFRLDLCHLGENKSAIILSMHHIISDGWTLHLFVNQLLAIYQGQMPEFSNYLDMLSKENEYFQTPRFEKSRNYWLNQFENLPDQDLRYSQSTASKRISKKISVEDIRLLNALKERYKTSYNVLLIAAFGLYEYCFLQKKDIVYGIPVLNRSGPVQKNTIGMFTSTMPLRFQIHGKQDISDLMNVLVEKFKKCLLHQRYPYNQLIENLNLRQKGVQGLFDTCINYYVAKTGEAIGGVPVHTKERHNGHQDYSFQLVIEEDKDEIHWFYDIKTELYNDEWVEQTHERLLDILKQLNVVQQVRELTFESDELILKKRMREEILYSYDHILDAFKEQVEKKGDQIAIYDVDKEVTYNELEYLSDQYGAWFSKNGIEADDCIALTLPHSKELIAIILGLYKIGAYYVPIDPAYPEHRVAYIMEDASCKMLLNETFFNQVTLGDTEFKSCRSRLAYILYTSGSTGRPKGVMVKHTNLASYAQWGAEHYMDEGDIFAFYSSIGFDLTITSIFVPLVCGESMMIYPPNQDEFVLYQILKDKRATVVKLTPSHLKLLIGKLKNSVVKRMILGGENLKVDLCQSVYEEKAIELINEYGPTEATVGCMTYIYNPLKDIKGSVPIGKPAANTDIWLLNENMSFVPNGVKGEIYIGGHHVTEGYLNLEEKTKKHFVFIEGKRFYKTGDFAKYLPSGDIEYLGRMDNQVKLNGHRIEIEEINSALKSMKGIQEAVTKIWKKSLVSFYVSQNHLENDEIMKHLKQRLPHYMLPRLLTSIEEVPLTINGKVDFDALKIKETLKKETVRSELEKLVLEIIQEIIDVKNLDLGDNFFYQGGDSIKAIQIASALSEQGYELKVKDIMNSQSIGDIIGNIVQLNELITYDQRPSTGMQIKSPIMQWFENHHFSNENYYNQSVRLKLKQNKTLEEINVCMNQLIKKHDVLRLKKSGEEFYYESASNNIIKESQITPISCKELKASLSLDEGHLIKGLYDGHELLLTVHHLAIDGISWRILLKELDDLLSGRLLKEKRTSYQKWFENYEDVLRCDQEVLYSNSSNELIVENLTVQINERKLIRRKLSLLELNKCFVPFQQSMNIAYDEYILYHLVDNLRKCFSLSEWTIEMEHHGRFDREGFDISQTVGWFTVLYPVLVELTDSKRHDLRIVKDLVRHHRKKGYAYMYRHNGKLRKERCVRFNFLGDLSHEHYEHFEMSLKDHEADVDPLNIGSSLMDVDTYIQDEHLVIQIGYQSADFLDETINTLLMQLIEGLLKNDAIETEETYLSVSDFDDLDITLDELDSLFE